MAAPAWRLPWTDQAAALAVSATARPPTEKPVQDPVPVVTVRPAVAPWDWPPPVPVTEMVAGPAGVAELVVTVRVAVWPAGTWLALSWPLAPEGRPPTPSVMLAGGPETTAVLTV